MRIGVKVALVVLQGLALARPLAARERIDLVRLEGGDQVTGEIIRLEAANLSVRTRAFGTVDVDWPDVVGLVSIQAFEVERADGQRFAGRLDEGEQGGVLVVRRFELPPVEIPLDQVVGIDQVGASLWASRRGYVDLGWNFSQADSDTTLSLEAELAVHGRRFRWVNAISASLSDDTNDEQRQREILKSTLEIPLGTRFVLIGLGQHERNDDLGLDARDTAGGVFGWLPVNGARGRVVLGPGAAESREVYADHPETTVVTSGAFLVAGEFHRFGRFGTRAEISILWFPVLSGPDRDRVEVRAALRQKVGSNFTLSVSPYYSYDSLPPAAEAAGEDWGWASTVGWSF